ncbi:MAG: DUF1576 domain-containing protein [Spirochaetes bacterium]|nr:DUF1576 domain-containing protein [Spirochaetota bacterium]
MLFNFTKLKKEKFLFLSFLSYFTFLILLSFLFFEKNNNIKITFNPLDTLKGFFNIISSPSRLIVDYFYISSPNSAIFNASILAILSLLIIYFNKVKIAGPSIAAIFTVFGFSLFGKNIFNVLPIIIGVYLSAKFVRKNFNEYILISLFGTAISPIVSTIAFESNLSLFYSIPISIFVGILVGFFLPPIGVYLLRMHQGYNLYNIGFTCGFFGLFIGSILKKLNFNQNLFLFWFPKNSYISIFLIIFTFIFFIFLTLININKFSSLIKSFINLQKESGRLPSDFITTNSNDAVFLNVSILILVFFLICIFFKIPLNGPVLGGIFTIIGFATFGKNLYNTIFIVLGVILSIMFFRKELNSPVPALAILFCTSLAPFTGGFGPIIGIIAGFLHFIIVNFTASWAMGINLYNNGFSAGIVSILLLSIIDWIFNYRIKK